MSHAVLNCLYILSFLESLSTSARERRVRLPNHKTLPSKTSRCYSMTERKMYPVQSSVIFSTSPFTVSQQRAFVCWKDVRCCYKFPFQSQFDTVTSGTPHFSQLHVTYISTSLFVLFTINFNLFPAIVS